MFHVLAVDDEHGSLSRLSRLLENEPGVLSLTTFTNPEEALSDARTKEYNLAFLDMEMPHMNGLTLAQKLREIRPSISIIFLTAYDQYALNAFRVHADGYILKPFSYEDIHNELVHLLDVRQVFLKKLHVQCLGSLQCIPEGADLPIKFRTAKAEELFALLIDSEKKPRTRDFLIDTLWPDAEDAEKAGNHFRVTCSYLRNALSEAGLPEALQRYKDSFTLDYTKIDCDLFAFTEIADRYTTATKEELLTGVMLYRGAYLEDRYYDWLFDRQAWFSSLYMSMLFKLFELQMQDNDNDAAELTLHKILLNDPLNENAIRQSVLLRKKNRGGSSAKDLYTEMRNRYEEEMGLPPSREFEKTIRDILDS